MRSQTNEIVSWRGVACVVLCSTPVQYAFDCGVCFVAAFSHQYEMNRKCLEKKWQQQQKQLEKNEAKWRWLYKVHWTILYTNLWQAENANRFVHEINVIKPNKIYIKHISSFSCSKLHSKWIERAQYLCVCMCLLLQFGILLLMKQKQNTRNGKRNIQDSERSEIKMLFTNESCIHEMFKWISNVVVVLLCSKDIFRSSSRIRKKIRETFFS